MENYTRRELLAGGGATAAAVLAGCSDDTGSEEEIEEPSVENYTLNDNDKEIILNTALQETENVEYQDLKHLNKNELFQDYLPESQEIIEQVAEYEDGNYVIKGNRINNQDITEDTTINDFLSEEEIEEELSSITQEYSSNISRLDDFAGWHNQEYGIKLSQDDVETLRDFEKLTLRYEDEFNAETIAEKIGIDLIEEEYAESGNTTAQINQSSELPNNQTVDVTTENESQEKHTVDIPDEEVKESIPDYIDVLNVYSEVRKIDEQDGDGHSEKFIQSLDSEFEQLHLAYQVGERYEDQDESSSNRTTLTGLKLNDEITLNELKYLKTAEELPEKPEEDDWSGDGVTNSLMLDLGYEPQEEERLLGEIKDRYDSLKVDSDEVIFERKSSITGESIEKRLDYNLWNDLREGSLSSLAEDYGTSYDSRNWEGSELVESRDKAISDTADFAIMHFDQEPELVEKIVKNGIEDSKRRSPHSDTTVLEKISGVNSFTDIYIENGYLEESFKFYGLINGSGVDTSELTRIRNPTRLKTDAISSIKDEIEDSEEIPKDRSGDPESPRTVASDHHTPTTSSSSSSSSSGSSGGSGGNGGSSGDSGRSRGGGPGGS